MREPLISPGSYIFTWVALLIITLAMTLLGYVTSGPWAIIMPVLFALVQAALIAGVFMHALHKTPIIRVIVAGGVVWFLIMISLTLGDYLTRGWLSFPGK